MQKYMIILDYHSNKTIKEISKKYNASISSVYKILKDHNDDSASNKFIKLSINKYSVLNKEERKFIKEYVQTPQFPLTLQSINNELNQKFWEKERKRDIKNYLKSELKYTYKKGSSTTSKSGSDSIKYQQSIFSARILQEIISNKILINIDECSF